MKKKTIAFLLVVICCFTGCGSETGKSNLSQTSKNDTENTGGQSAKEEEEHVYLPEKFFNNAWERSGEVSWENFITNFCLTSYYDCPEDVDLSWLLGKGFGIQITEEDRDFFKTQTEREVDWDMVKLPREKIDEVLKQYFDISLEESNKVGLEMLWYREETDTYYGGEAVIEKVNVEKQYLDEAGNIVVEYTFDDMGKYAEKGIAVLKLKGNRYVFLSNKKMEQSD